MEQAAVLGKNEEKKLFQPGGKPGPGRPKGSRDKLQRDFLKALSDDFSQHGAQALADCRSQNPAAYIKAIASLMPKEIEITRPLDDLSDDQLDAALAAVRAVLAAQSAGAGEGSPEGHESPQGLPALPQAG